MTASPRWTLTVLLLINLLNYLDRQVLYALLPLVQNDLGASDARMGALASAFMGVYMCAAIPVGFLAERSARKIWIALGVAAWSAATALSGLAQNYRQLFVARAAVGVGESCYGSVSPAFIAECFPRQRRAGVLALFSMAIPVGSALGYILGGIVGHHWGWRAAFFLAGLPGLALSWAAWNLKDPREEASASPDRASAPAFREYLRLCENRSWLSCTMAMAAMTFGLGAFAVWMPTFFHRTWNLDVSQAGGLFGAITVLAGLSGSLAGGWLADRLLPATRNAYLLVSGVGLLLSLPLSYLSLTAERFSWALASLTLTEFCVFLNMGPLNALIVSVTRPRMRSMAFAANIFVIHLLGDAFSPAVVGYLSDRIGLKNALLLAASSLGLSGGACFWGMRYVEKDSRLAEP